MGSCPAPHWEAHHRHHHKGHRKWTDGLRGERDLLTTFSLPAFWAQAPAFLLCFASIPAGERAGLLLGPAAEPCGALQAGSWGDAAASPVPCCALAGRLSASVEDLVSKQNKAMTEPFLLFLFFAGNQKAFKEACFLPHIYLSQTSGGSRVKWLRVWLWRLKDLG